MKCVCSGYEVDVLQITNCILLAPGGTLAFFEYAGFPSIRCLVPGPWQQHAKAHRTFLEKLAEPMSHRRTFVLRNILPAWAVYLRATES